MNQQYPPVETVAPTDVLLGPDLDSLQQFDLDWESQFLGPSKMEYDDGGYAIMRQECDH